MKVASAAANDSGRAEVGGVSVPVDQLIGGEWVGSPATFETRSPLDWDAGPLAEVARGDEATADAAVDAAVAGFAEWGSYTVGQRAEVMHRMADPDRPRPTPD